MELSNLTLLSGRLLKRMFLEPLLGGKEETPRFKVRCCTILIWWSFCCMRNRRRNAS